MKRDGCMKNIMNDSVRQEHTKVRLELLSHDDKRLQNEATTTNGCMETKQKLLGH